MNKLFSDLVLTLTNDKSSKHCLDSYSWKNVGEIIIDTHKFILAKNSPFFYKLLTSDFKEKDQNNITIQVPDIHVVNNIIGGFYDPFVHPTNWHYVLMLIKCYDYLDMNIDKKLIKNLVVPTEGFDLLLDAIELIGYDEETIKLINDNLPKDYDLARFPKDLLNELSKINTSFQIISGCKDGTVQLWNALTGNLIYQLVKHREHINCVRYSPDAKQIIVGGADGIVEIWDSLYGNIISKIFVYEPVNSVTYSPDNQLIVSGSQYGKIKIWNAQTGKLFKCIDKSDNKSIGSAYLSQSIESVCYSPDNKRILTGNDDGLIKIWDAESGNLIKTINNYTSITSVCYSPNNQHFATGGRDKMVRIWDAETGELIHSLSGHSKNVTEICYSLDGKRIVSGSSDQIIKIWDATTGLLIRDLIGHTDNVRCVRYSPDNQMIISGGTDKTIRIWDAMTGELIQTISDLPQSVYSVDMAIIKNTQFFDRLPKNDI